MSNKANTQEKDVHYLQYIINKAYNLFKNNNEGKNADYISHLRKANKNHFSIAITTMSGETYSVGDSNIPFSIQSISKVFNLALAMEQYDYKYIQDEIGVSSTGMEFNSIISLGLGQIQNPMVNAGAMATVSILKGKIEQVWEDMLKNMCNFAGSKQLTLNKNTFKSEMSENSHNKAIAELLYSYKRFHMDTSNGVYLYTKGCSIDVNTIMLSKMAATLSNFGINPISFQKVITKENTIKILAIMSQAGLYNSSGDWMYETGIPAKSGVSGGIIGVVPGRFGISAFSPLLDKFGNSIRAQKAIAYILKELKCNVFNNS